MPAAEQDELPAGDAEPVKPDAPLDAAGAPGEEQAAPDERLAWAEELGLRAALLAWAAARGGWAGLQGVGAVPYDSAAALSVWVPERACRAVQPAGSPGVREPAAPLARDGSRKRDDWLRMDWDGERLPG